jgi:hypothetical protein
MTYPLGGHGVYNFTRAELYAADFSGANYLSSTSSNFDFADDDFALTFWFYHGGGTPTGYLGGKWTSGSGKRSYLLLFSGSKVDSATYIGGVAKWCTSTVTVSAAGWYHVAYFHNKTANTVNISVNNETMVSTATGGGGLNSSTDPFTIGAGDTTSTPVYVTGRVDSYSVYTKILTQTQIGNLYNSGSGVTYEDMDKTSLQNHYKLNELTGARIDIHGSDNLTDNSSVGRAVGKILD